MPYSKKNIPAVIADNSAVLGLPKGLSSYTTDPLYPSQTLDGWDWTGLATTNATIYPIVNPNFGNRDTKMMMYGSFIENEILARRSFNYSLPNIVTEPYIEKLAGEFGVALAEEAIADNQTIIRNQILMSRGASMNPAFPSTLTPALDLPIAALPPIRN